MDLKNLFGGSNSDQQLGAESPPDKGKSNGYWMPRNEVDVEWVGDKVCTRWENEPDYKIPNKTAQQMREKVMLFSSLLRQSNNLDSSSMPKTDRKNELLNEMRTAFKILFGYIQEKIFPDPNTDPYMREFGFTRNGNSYVFPNDELERLHALDNLILGVKKYGFEERTLGLDYWQGIRDEFATYVDNRNSNAGGRRVITTKKADAKLEVQRYLRAIKHLLSAVHDESDNAANAAFASWGFKYFH